MSNVVFLQGKGKMYKEEKRAYIQETIRELSHVIEASLEDCKVESLGFVLSIFEIKRPGLSACISNCSGDGLIEELKDMARVIEEEDGVVQPLQ